MSSTQSSFGVALLCDLNGNIVQIVRNDQNLPKARSFLSFIDPANTTEAQNFLLLARTEGAACGWNFNLSEKQQTTSLDFLAYRDGDVISMVGASTRSEMYRVCKELAEHNHLFLGNFFQAIAYTGVPPSSFALCEGTGKQSTGIEQAEAELRRKEAELEEAQRLAQIGSWEWDPVTDAVSWSRELLLRAGCDPRLPAPPFREHSRFFTPESWVRLTKHVENTLQTGTPYKLDLEATRSDGTRAWIVSRGEAVRDASGRIVRLRGTIQDITERKQLEERLREYENAIEGAEEMIAVVDRDYRYVIANHAFLNKRKLTREQVVGRLASEVMLPGSFEIVKENLDQCLKGNVIKFEMKYSYPDIGERELFVSYFPIHGPAGINRVSCIFQDITDRKQAEHRLRQTKRELLEAQRLAHLGSWQWDVTTNTFTWSEELYRIHGLDPKMSPPPYEQISKLFEPASWDRLQSAMEEAVQTGLVRDLELEAVRPDGNKRWLAASGEAVRNAEGCVTYLRGTVQDITEHKRAEQAVQESEIRERHKVKELETILETLPIAVMIAKDPECKTIIANRAGYELLRLAPGRNISKSAPREEQPNFRILRDGNDVPAEQLPMQSAIRGRKPVFGITEFVQLEDGSQHEFVANAAPLLREDGTPYGAVGAVLDVTERNRTEQALRRSEEKFSKAFRQSPMALSLSSCRDHRYIEVNETFEKITGFRHEEIIGRTPFDINIWVDPSERVELERRILSEGSLRNLEYQFRMKDGSIRTALSSAELIEIEGEPCVLGVSADITEFKQTQQALLHEKNLTDTLLDTIPGILFLFDEQGKPIRWNKRAEEITGYLAEEIAQLNVLDFHSEATQELIAKTLRRGLDEGYAEVEAKLKLKSGKEIPFYFTGASLNIEGKRHLVGVGIDISARKHAEGELKKLSGRLITAQEEERSRLARGLHDDTSQRFALLAMQLEQLGHNLPADQGEIRASLLDLHQQVSDLAADVHRLSRRLHPSLLDRVGLVPALRSMCDEVRRQNKIAVTFTTNDVPDRLPEAVSLCLFRVAEEATNNALRHSGASEIRVELAADSRQVRLRISDSGRGFELNKIETAEGLGLLSMKERLHQVEGELSIQSAPNEGTRIEARIPIASAEHTKSV